MNRYRLVALLCAVSCFVGTSGCSGSKEDPRGTVRGRVTVGGKPLSGATIVFENKELGVAQTATLDDDGKYTVASHAALGLPPGSYKVSFSSGRFMAPGEEIPKIDVAPKNSAAPKKAPTAIPDKYTKANTSGLTADVQAGENPPYDFDLK